MDVYGHLSGDVAPTTHKLSGQSEVSAFKQTFREDVAVFTFSILFIQTHKVDAIQCYSCLDVSDTNQCPNVTQCAVNEHCFIERFGNIPYSKFNLGCAGDKICPTQPSHKFSIIGRDVSVLPVPDCRQCCDTDNCNNQSCDFQLSLPTAPSHVSGSPCADKDNNCAQFNASLQICADVQYALTICKKFCGLCSRIDGNWNIWSSWSACSVTCGQGTLSRIRSCSNPPPANGGLQCVGAGSDTKSCYPRECPVHGAWSDWSPWGSCSVTCGLGLTKRRRTCTNPRPSMFGHYCFGDATDSDLCNITNCAYTVSPTPPPTPPTPCVDTLSNCNIVNKTFGVCADSLKARTVCKNYCGLCSLVDGKWGKWGTWSRCSRTCGNGTKSRSRLCDSPAPINGGSQCQGQAQETSACIEHECPVHGGWSIWGSWADCGATCGTGLTHRRRLCNNPTPSLFGAYCLGDPVDYALCRIKPCLGDGHWTSWTSWSQCLCISYSSSARSRYRICLEPQSGGKNCTGSSYESSASGCSSRSCYYADGHWTDWTSWGQCYCVSSSSSVRSRYRLCLEPQYGGQNCTGSSYESSSTGCNSRSCYRIG